jgi:serine/threonine-protein kinase ATR
VLNAIRKVERYCAEVASHKTAPPNPPANFLKLHILGIISHISGILQDDQGKKPLMVKIQAVRCIKQLVAIIGPHINVIAPQVSGSDESVSLQNKPIAQIMTTMQNMIHRDGLESCTLETWLRVVDTLPASEFGPYLGVTAATFVKVWSKLNADSRSTVQRVFDHILQRAEQFSAYIADICSLRHISELTVVQERLDAIRPELNLQDHLKEMCRRAENPNPSVSYLALVELKRAFNAHDQITDLVSGDAFDPVVGQLIKTLFVVTSREGEVYEEPRLAALECIGLLGAVDPDRFDFPAHDDEPFIYLELEDDTTSVRFAEYLIVDVLVGIFRSTADPQFQAQLSYAIQELLSFCGFNAGLVMPGTTSVSLNARNRWGKLPTDIIATVAPLLDGKFSFTGDYPPISSHPIYHSSPGYRDWIQKWVGHLISHTSGARTKAIFVPFRAVLRATDVQVCRRLLPYLLLNILVTGRDHDVGAVQREMEAVLQDQVNSMSEKPYDQRLLCAQVCYYPFQMNHII